MGSHYLVLAFLCFFEIIGYVHAGNYCVTSRYGTSIEYCDHGCCGSYPNKYCCIPWGSIIGGVIGGLFFFGIIITIIVVCCKKQSRPGMVVQPGTAGPAVIMASTQQQYPGFNQAQQPYPPMQPGYGAGGPAYPPAYPGNSQGQAPPGYPGQHNPAAYPGNEPK